MDFSTPFPNCNGNGNNAKNGYNLKDSSTLAADTSRDSSGPSVSNNFSEQYSNYRLPLPGFETLFNSTAAISSYDASGLGADIDSFLAEQGEEFSQSDNQPHLASSSGNNNLFNSPPAATDFGKLEPLKNGTSKMADLPVEENFMGFRPLDSNGNASDESPSPAGVSPLKVKALEEKNVERNSRDTSVESGSDGSASDNDYKSAEEDMDTGNNSAKMEKDETHNSEDESGSTRNAMEVDVAAAEAPPGDAVDGSDSEKGKSEALSSGRTAVQETASSDDKVTPKESETQEKDVHVVDSDAGQNSDNDSADEQSQLDHSYSQSPRIKSETEFKLEVEDEDDEKLVIDDDDGVENESKGVKDVFDEDGDSTDVDVEGSDGKSDALLGGFTPQTPHVPNTKSMCWCGGEETKEMIACDSPRCKLVWYHYTCVNVKPDEIPEGDWYCPTCIESGFNNKERPDTAEHKKLSDDEANKRKRKQTLKARDAASDDDIEFEITVNEDDSDHDQSQSQANLSKEDDMVDDPLTGGKVFKKKKTPVKLKPKCEGQDSGSEGEFELPSWHSNPKELFEGVQRPQGPRAIKLKKPFEYGWAREIVVRFKYESLKGSGRPPMDVYYFTPEGKKLRSIIQIADYLAECKNDNGLTTENFSLNRIPVHKEPWENIRMANIGRSAGSVKGHVSKRGRPPKGRGKSPMARPIGRPSKNYSMSPVPSFVTEPEEKEEPKSFPEMLNLKPVNQVGSTSSDAPPTKQKARKSFRPMEIPKRLLSPLEQTMPDPKRLKVKAVQGDRHENHIQLHNEGGFRLCSLDCLGQAGKPPTLHCGVCMCLFHPECVQFVGNTAAALFVCERCRKQPTDSSKVNEKVTLSGDLLAASSKYEPEVLNAMKSQLAPNTSVDIPRNMSSAAMIPLTIEKAVHETDATKVSPGGTIVPPPPSLKPMTVAAHLKSMAYEQKKQQTGISWTVSEGNLNVANTGIMPKPPPLKTIRAPLGQLSSVTTMPLLTSKPTTSPVTGSAIRSALSERLQSPIGTTIGTTGPPATVVSAGNSNDIRMAGQLLTLPGNIINRIKMNEPLALKINNQSLVVNPDCFVQTSHGVKIFLPPNTLPVQGGNKTINITVPQSAASLPPVSGVKHSSGSTLQASSCTPVVLGASLTEPGTKTTATPDIVKPAFTNTAPAVSILKPAMPQLIPNFKTVASNSISQPMMVGQGLVPVKHDLPPAKSTRRRTLEINPAKCFIQQFHMGYDSLLQIFSYLSVPDLLKVSQVCRRWRSIVTEPWMWRTVKLRGTYVTDWDTAMKFLQKVETKKLDLRGLRHIDDRNRTWHQITGVLDKMVDLTVVHFGQCPASILHAVTEKLSLLKILTAEWITEIFEEPQMWTTNTKLDMAKFAKLSHMEELRLRGVCGLILPSFSFSGGLEELSALQKLKKLSLTTLKDVRGNDFNFIGQLTNLEELEMGDCLLWTEETYKHLSKLEKLKILRLENGGELEDPGLASALKCLKQLTKLELVMFIIPSTLKDCLGELEHLRELSVWPDPRDQPAIVNTNTINAIKDLKRLKKLEWGVVTGDENETEEEDHGNLPFLQSAFAALRKKDEQNSEGQDSATEVDSENQEDKNEAKKDQDQEEAPEVITTQKLHDRLSVMLVETKVTINDVAVLSSQKGRSRSKST